MVGSLGGFAKVVKMERFDILAGIGKQEIKEDGMGAQIYLVNFMKALPIL